MKKRNYLFIYFGSLFFFVAISFLQKTPGYMDASYYYSLGKQLVTGKGFTEPFIWNYLANPTTIPTPAFTYWMPMAALLSALGMFLLNSTTFFAARIPFILLAGLIPVINIYFASLFSNNKLLWTASAILGIASGYYLAYLTITETFVPFFILGGLFFIFANKILQAESSKRTLLFTFLLGVITGLMHLTRADGILWLLGCFILIVLFPQRNKYTWANKLFLFGLCLSGYIAIMSPWYIRNLVVFRSIFPNGSNLALFFRDYNDLFAYPIKNINILYILSSPINQLFIARFNAGVANLGNIIGIIGEIVIFPFMLIGVLLLRKEKLIQLSIIMLSIIFLMMTLFFPFAGQRGGFFHSASALQCIFWGISPLGFEYSIKKIAAFRKWKAERSIRLLGSTLIGVLIILSGLILFSKITGFTSKENQGWDEKYDQFSELDTFLINNLITPDQVIMVNDSPGYYVMTGRSAIQMTSGSIQSAISAMGEFKATFLILDESHSPEFDLLYTSSKDYGMLQYFDKYKNFVIYKLEE
ncbi:MAG: ArnT family glycosyltransferase [Anaerolineaceae bacterium]